MKKTLLLITACILSGLPLMAGRLHFDNISTESGLSNKMVLSIAQDTTGFIWIATAEGLNRYDGSVFKVYLHRPGDELSLGASWVNDLLVTREGTLLVATEMGLNVFDPVSDSFSVAEASGDSQHLLSTMRFKCLFEDSGGIWAGTSEGLVRLRYPDRSVSFTKLSVSSGDARANEVKGILRDGLGRLWAASFDGLYLLDGNGNPIRRFIVRPQGNYYQKNNYVSSLCYVKEDPDHLYIGTSNGLAIMDTDDFTCRYLTSQGSGLCDDDLKFISSLDAGHLIIGTSNGLSVFSLSSGGFENYSSTLLDRTSIASQTVWCSFEDRLGVVWLGTSNGISKMDKNRKSLDFFRIVTTEKEMVREVMVNDLAFVPGGDLWIGTNGGIRVYGPGMNREKSYSLGSSGLPHNIIKRILVCSGGTVWVGTNNGIAYYDRVRDRFVPVPPNLPDVSLNYVYDMIETPDGKIVVNISNGLCIFSPSYTRSGAVSSYGCKAVRLGGMVASDNTDITYLDCGADGRIWFGTINDGLFSYDDASGKIVQYPFRKDDPKSISSNRIYTIHVDSSGAVWVGTDMGLCRLDPATGEFRRFQDDPVLSRAVRTITSDSQGRIWLCLLNKIVMLDYATGNKTVCDVGHDVDCNELEYNSFCNKGDLLYFGGYGGFVKVNPFSVKVNNVRAPMRITGVGIAGKGDYPSVPREKLVLSPRNNTVSISFSLLYYSSEANNSYDYRLEGHDQMWHHTEGSRNMVTFSNLSPGNYRFVVRGYNSDGVFGGVDSFSFRIQKPMWVRWWAILLYLAVTAAIIGIVVWQMVVHRRLSSQLDAEKEERSRVESLNKVKMNFFTNISHEFKTPLSLILGPLESMMEGASDRKQLAMMELMKQNGERMLRQINQILELREIDNDKLSFVPSSGDLVPFARHVFDSFQENARRRNMTCEFIAEDELPCTFDKEKMEHILYNLLSNAFKFTPDGGTVQLSLSYQDTKPEPKVKVSVTDSGQGITEADLPHIFDRFYQGEARCYEKISSTGIGLGLTKDFVELHGGSISVESVRGEGSSFTFTIPCRLGEVDGQGPEPALSDPSDRKIVVIDDNADIISFIKLNLGETFTVLSSTSPEKGLALIRETCPDVVILDVMMPDMDGIELCRRLRSDQLTSHIPVIFLTAKGTEDDIARGYGAGADGYLTKPFSIKVLTAKIDILIKSRESLKEYYRNIIQNRGAEISLETEDDRFMGSLIGEIEKNIDNSEYSVQDLCRDLGYSYLQIYRKVKALTGITINEFIRNLRLSKAAYLLENSEMRVSEIMYSVGFSTHSYFTRCFKDLYGVTPKEYSAGRRDD